MLLVASGCGNSPDPADPAAAAGTSPLEQYMGKGFSSGTGGGPRVMRIGEDREPTEEELSQRRQIESAIARCMQAEGFRYVPVGPEADPKSKFDDAFKLPPDKFAEQYGYGISTIDLSNPEENDNDPNTAIRNALSAQAKKAYDKALNGADGNDGRVVIGSGKSQTKSTPSGCRGKAVTEVMGDPGKRLDPSKFDSLFKDLRALQQRIESDERVTTAAKAWSDCMADAGRAGFTKPADAPAKVSDKLDVLTGQQSSRGAKTGPPSLENVDPQKLAELRKFEIDLAKADQSCRAKTYDAAYKKAQLELEQEFVDAHQAELEQFRDQMAQK